MNRPVSLADVHYPPDIGWNESDEERDMLSVCKPSRREWEVKSKIDTIWNTLYDLYLFFKASEESLLLGTHEWEIHRDAR